MCQDPTWSPAMLHLTSPDQTCNQIRKGVAAGRPKIKPTKGMADRPQRQHAKSDRHCMRKLKGRIRELVPPTDGNPQPTQNQKGNRSTLKAESPPGPRAAGTAGWRRKNSPNDCKPAPVAQAPTYVNAPPKLETRLMRDAPTQLLFLPYVQGLQPSEWLKEGSPPSLPASASAPPRTPSGSTTRADRRAAVGSASAERFFAWYAGHSHTLHTPVVALEVVYKSVQVCD